MNCLKYAATTSLIARYLGTRLILEGAADDVREAHDQVQEVLREFTAAETRATYAVWQEKSKSGDWKDLSPRSSSDLEETYQVCTR